MTTTKEETFHSRGISDTVREARGYPYLKGAPHEHGTDGTARIVDKEAPAAAIDRDVAKVRAVDPAVTDDEYTDALRSRVKLGAWAMLKHPAMPEYGPIRAQFKEDHPPLKPRKHWHGDFGKKARAKHVNGKRSGHGGTDTDDIHTHRKPAKYHMMPKPRRRFEHPHYSEGAPPDLNKHVADPARSVTTVTIASTGRT